MWSHYAEHHRGICLEFDALFGFTLSLVSLLLASALICAERASASACFRRCSAASRFRRAAFAAALAR